MHRRKFLSTFLGGATAGLSIAAPGDGPERTHGARDRDEQAIASQRERLAARVEELSGEVEMLSGKLAEADRHRAHMLYLVHTMRSPLACMQIRTELMRDDARCEISDALSREVEMNARSCEALAQLVNDVFALERSHRQAQT
jgi:signal transduction histidine kinase